MKRLNVVAGAVAGVVLLLGAASAGERRAAGVTDRAGQTIKTFTENGDAVSARAATSRATSLAARQPAADCAQTTRANPLVTTRSSLRDGATVDPCGRFDAPPRVGPLSATAAAGSITIDGMTTRGSYYGTTYTPGGTLLLLGSADTYTLSNGSTWQSGAGSYYSYSTALDHVEVSGGGIRYVLFPPPYGGNVYQQTDYDSGDHSAQGTLAAVGPLVIEATAGSTTAVMKGNVLVVANDATSYGEPRFNYYGALVGSVVPFELTYTLQGGATWQADTFTHSFSYLNPGSVDFTRPVTTPEVVELTIGGPAEVPDETVVQYSATARYANGVTTPVAAVSSWHVAPTTLASIDGGLLTLGKLSTPRETLTLSASYVEGGVTVSATKTVICVPSGSVHTDAWPMYQANAQHTGYLPLSLSPEQAHLLWQRELGSAHALNPVAAADGRVFATVQVYFDDIPTLFALDAQTGATIWSKSFGSVFSVNPPSTAYGSVYVQTGDHATDTWLWAFDAATGAQVFKTPHAAQWERYYAPTIYDGKAYVDGGSYGGMYGFDAFSGRQEWFATLPQYDQWTPAISGDLAHAYVGEYSPGLYTLDRHTGRLVSVIADPSFEWNGWSMNLAPVVGGAGDVFAIHDGRLICFDVSLGAIRWELARTFVGQVSEARGKLYAIDGTRLVVLDEGTGNELWSWQAPDGALAGPVVVTDTHLVVSSATSVHVVSLDKRESVWSYPVVGQIAIADGNLYVASSDGTLTAIAMPTSAAASLEGLEITGPTEVVEASTVPYRALAHYSDGQVRERTLSAQWSVAPSTYAGIGSDGALVTTELIRPAEDVLLRAQYDEGGRSVSAALNVHVVIGVSIPELIRRNIEASLEIKAGILRDLDAALEREGAARALRSLPALRSAILQEAAARRQIVSSVRSLGAALKKLGFPVPAAASRPERDQAIEDTPRD